MSPGEVVKNKNTPAWISACAAVLVGCIAVYSFAGAPTRAQLEDHENRLRVQEKLTSEQLATITVQLKILTDEVRRLRGLE